VVALGSRVEDEGERVVFQLVDSCEASIAEGRLSVASPVGRALLGQAVGTEVAVRLPAGERRVRLVVPAGI
jgi:transcription elongation GreA/GreB family factor